MTGGCSMNAGPLAFRLGLRGMPVEAEAGIVARDIALLRELKNDRAHLHVAHLSTKKALDHVRAARKSGLHVTCEVTPHHFVLTEEAVGEYDTHAKMNPPLRTAADRDAMIEGLLDGTIDCIATDHAPHAAHEKEQEFERAPNGITGLGDLSRPQPFRSASAAWHAARAGACAAQCAPCGGSWTCCRHTCCWRAARTWCCSRPRRSGASARANRAPRSRNTPFDGWSLPGKVHLTMHAGQVVYGDAFGSNGKMHK